MEIYIIDNTTLDRLGTIDEYKSLTWETSYNGIGSFELNCSMAFFSLLQTERFVSCNSDEKHIGIIEDVLKLTADDGSESLRVKGRMAEALLDRRVALDYAHESTQPAEIAAALITANAIDTRPIENLKIGDKVDAPEGVIDLAGSGQSLLSEVQAICKASNIGFNISANTDAKELVFNTYLGVNRTEEDNTETEIIENNCTNMLQNAFFTDGFTSWNTVNNRRGFNYYKQEYISDYSLQTNDGIISKTRVKSIIDVSPDEEHVELEDYWEPSPYMTQEVNLDSSHIYYVAASCKNPLNAVLSFGIKEGDTFTLNFNKSNGYLKKCMLFVPQKTDTYTYYAGYGELEEKNGQFAYWDYCILVDLTAVFGVGKEPELTWCDKNIYISEDMLKYKTQVISFIENDVTPLVFSRDRDTLISVEYEKSITNECNYIYIKGDGLTTFITAGEATGLALKERFLDLSYIPRTVDEVELPEESYIAMLQNSAKATMRQLVVNEMIDGTLYTLSNKKFGRDFYLGDIAAFVDDKMGITVNLRISSVQQVWSAEGYTVTVSLGDDIPNIYETIKLVGRGAK